ncbi:hypothetical protein DW718_00615 [Weissella cibaria]|uniref:STAS-like domain-containing protein n=1 Tax=Weissella cibaria TaxID=137591 RepID=UPI000E516A42|nr:DUF4325 domain-containing protein [Weissella cibaria]RHE73761.1 hypothetical protein DW718_00615 [Weissella cibaria]RHE79496.1 hypothetical protein DW717_00615 [Weissella cibaria]
MYNTITVKVADVINSEVAVTNSDALVLFDEIKSNIDKQTVSVLDFSNIKTLTTAFLNLSIGNLYSIAEPDVLSKFVRINPNAIKPLQYEKVVEVIQNAKQKRSGNN